jgi:hypothetical protein
MLINNQNYEINKVNVDIFGPNGLEVYMEFIVDNSSKFGLHLNGERASNFYADWKTDEEVFNELKKEFI